MTSSGPSCEVVGVRDFGVFRPRQRGRRLQAFERGGEGGRRSVDRKMRVIDAAEFLRAGMHMHQRLLRAGNVEQRVTLARHLAHPSADQQQHVGILDARDDFRVGADAEIAGVTRMRLVEEMTAAE
jgi:hypothetical protein